MVTLDALEFLEIGLDDILQRRLILKFKESTFRIYIVYIIILDIFKTVFNQTQKTDFFVSLDALEFLKNDL